MSQREDVARAFPLLEFSSGLLCAQLSQHCKRIDSQEVTASQEACFALFQHGRFTGKGRAHRHGYPSGDQWPPTTQFNDVGSKLTIRPVWAAQGRE
ncbi:hypothetical protein D3C81_2042830 [compost metagenome]